MTRITSDTASALSALSAITASSCAGALSGAVWGYKAVPMLPVLPASALLPFAGTVLAMLEGAIIVGALSALTALLYQVGRELCGPRAPHAPHDRSKEPRGGQPRPIP